MNGVILLLTGIVAWQCHDALHEIINTSVFIYDRKNYSTTIHIYNRPDNFIEKEGVEFDTNELSNLTELIPSLRLIDY